LSRLKPDLPSPDPHVILDRPHALDATCNLDRFVDVSLGTDEAAQLRDALERATLISADFREGSLKTAAFVVRTVSSI
jgi:hypothetical protein